jgi:hypothetical protein
VDVWDRFALLQWRSVSIHYEQGWSEVDVHRSFSAQIDQFGVGRIVRIHGSEALVPPSQGEAFPSEQLLLFGDTMLEVLGYDMSEWELIEITTSLSRSPESGCRGARAVLRPMTVCDWPLAAHWSGTTLRKPAHAAREPKGPGPRVVLIGLR